MTVLIATPNTDRRILDETAAEFGIRFGDFIEGERLLAVIRADIERRRVPGPVSASAVSGGRGLCAMDLAQLGDPT